MKFPFLLLLVFFQFTFAHAQWDLIATQPTAPSDLAIDSCGNGFARVANRVYRTADLGQTWDRVLDVPEVLSPSYRFSTTEGTINLSVYSTKSEVLYDYQFTCDGIVETFESSRIGACERYDFDIVKKNEERSFVISVAQPRGGFLQFPVAVDYSDGSGLQQAPSQISEAYYYELLVDPTGMFRFYHQPWIQLAAPVPTPPVSPLGIINAGWSIEAKEQAPDISFSDYSIVVSKKNSAGIIDSIAVATYLISNEEWTLTPINPVGLLSVRSYNSSEFLFGYTDRLEVRSASLVAEVLRTISVPVGFQLHNYSNDLTYVIGTVNDRVVIVNNGTVTVASSLEKGMSEWTPTLSGSLLVPSSAGFEEYAGNSSSTSPIDLDTEIRYVSVDTVGDLVYLVRQLNDRQQLLVQNPDGSVVVVVNALAGESEILDGLDDARIIRIGGENFRLEDGDMTPLIGRLSIPALTIRGADTLFIESGAAFLKRGSETSLIHSDSYSEIFISGGVYLLQKYSDSFGPRMRHFSALVVDVQTLEIKGQHGLIGPLEQHGPSLFSAIANGVSSGGPFASLSYVYWNGQRLVNERVGVPTYIPHSTAEICRSDGFWQSFSKIASGYNNIQYLNGTTYISGIHGVYKTSQCIAPETQQEQACLEQGQILTWNGLMIDAPGLYVDTSVSTTGCDRISYLQVGQEFTERLSECFLEGTNIPGTYITNTIDAAGCTQTQELTIEAPVTFQRDTMLQLGDILFGVTVVSNGQQITTSLNIDDCTEIYVYTISLVSSTGEVSAIDGPTVYPTLLEGDRAFRIRTSGQDIQRVEAFTLSGKQVEVNKTGLNTWQLTSSSTGWFVVRVQTHSGSHSTRVRVQ